MSRTIDEQIVEMRFDNQHFEKNVQTSMSTLDKFKEKLNFKGASKGLEDIERSAKKVDLSPLSKSAEKVGLKFNAMYTMADQAMRNITNSAMNYGKKIVSAFTIDPVKTGFQEYETQINAVQTILSNTRSKGTTLEDVNSALDTLNTYADKTIYNFTEMTRNIGTFTAAGVDLDTSVKAIQGIANLAAVSGSTSQQASTAMYQLSQALSSGTVKLMDWNSVVNAGMGGQVFQDALKETARLHGVAIDSMIEDEGSFRETLSKGWLTSEILTDTLEKFTMCAEEGTKEYEEFKKSLMDDGYTEEQAKSILAMGKDATEAATKVKTFTQLMDTLKEAAQSGWTQTWEIIFGDYEEAKELFSGLSDFLGNLINKMSNARNFLVEGALNFAAPWQKIMDKLDAAGFKKIADVVGEASDKLSYFQDVVDRVWLGEFNNWGGSPDRRDLLAAAGYDQRVVQELVNLGEKSWQAGQVYKLSIEEVEAAHKKFGLTMDTSSDSAQALVQAWNDLTDEQLKAAGLTDQEIQLYRDLAKEADRLGISMEELAAKMSGEKTNGRALLIDSLTNAGKGLMKVLKTIGEAWREIFPPMSVVTLYNIIDGIHEFSNHLVMLDDGDTIKDLKDTFKGLFAILDILLTVIGGPFKIAIKIFGGLLQACGLTILDVTGFVGRAAVKFRDFLNSMFDFTAIFGKVIPTLKDAATAFKDWIAGLKDSKDLPKDIADGIINGFGKLISFIKDKFSSFGTIITDGFSSVPGDAISGFANGIWNGMKIAGQVMVELGKRILEKFREVLGIHSPSTETAEDGKNFILGFIEGISEFAKKAWDTIKGFGSKCIEIFKKINFGKIFAVIASSGILVTIYKLASALSALTAPLEGVGEVLGGVGTVLTKAAKPIKKILNNTAKVVKSFSKVLSSFAFSIRAKALKDIAIALAILVAAVLALTLVEPDKLWEAVKILAALAGILLVLAGVTELLSKSSAKIGKEGFSIDGLKSGLLGIAASLLLIGLTVKIIGSMNPEQAKQGFDGLITIITSLILLFAAYGLLVKGKAAQNIDKTGVMLRKLATTLLLMVVVVKILGNMSIGELVQGGICIAAFGGIITGLIAASKLANPKTIDKIGKTILQMSAAILLMTVAVKLLGNMSIKELIQGGICVAAFGVIIVGLAYLMGKVGSDSKIEGIGKALIGIGGAILLMAAAVKLLGGMTLGEILKGGICVLAFAAMVKSMTKTLMKNASPTQMKGMALTLIAMSVAIGIMAGIAILLGMIDTKILAKGIVAVSILSIMMTGMIKACKGVTISTGPLIAMTVAIGVMAAAVAALSFIDTADLAVATLALGGLMGLFALMTKMSSGLKGFDVKAIVALTIMSATIGLMAGMIYLLAGLPVESVIASAASLAILVATMSGCLVLLTIVGKTAKDALLGVTALLAMALPLLAFVGILALMQGVKNAQANALTLVALATALTLLLVPLTLIGFACMTGAPYLGVTALLAMALPLLAFVGILYAMQGIENASENVSLLTSLMTVMTDCLVKISLVAPLTAIAVPAIAALTAVIVAFGLLITAIGALITKFPQLEEFVDTGIPIMEKLANGIGSVIGSFISGFATAAMSGLPEIGLILSQFIANAMPFITGIKMVDDTVLKGVGILAATIIALGVADLVTAITSFLSGGSSFASLGTELSKFMTNAMPFILGASLITEEMSNAVKNIAETILILTAADILDGLTSWLTGGSSFASFGEDMKPLGEGLASFAESIKDMSPETVEKVNLACQAIKYLAEASDKIPNSGGWLGKIMGENDLGDFASQFGTLGSGLSGFLTSIGTFGEAQYNTVKYAADAIVELANAASEIPNEGGWAGAIFGENGLGAFADDIPNVGTALGSFISNLGTFGEEQYNTVKYTADAILALANAASEIPNEGGWAAAICGDNSIAAFSDALPEFGTNLAEFTKNASDISIEAMYKVVNVLNALTMLNNSNVLDNGDKLESFGKSINKFANKLEDFSDKMSEVASSDLTSAKQKLADLLGIVTDIDNLNLESLTTFGDSLKKIAQDGLKKFVDTFKSEDEKAKAKKAINSLVTAIKDKIKSKDNYSKFKSAGKYLVEGLAEGIKNNKSLVTEAAEDVASAAYKAAKEELEINSPSKKFKMIGSGVVEGFVAGINDNLGDVDKSAEGLGKSMLTATQDTLKINSPSLVFKEGVGKWIVQGITEGIESDTSAEDAAKKKAQNIASAFNEELQRSNVKVEGYDLDYELWTKRNPNATDDEKDSAQINSLNKKLEETKRQTALYQSEQAQYEATLGKTSDEALEAVNKVKESQLKEFEIQEEIAAIQEAAATRKKDALQEEQDAAKKDIETRMDIRDNRLELWELEHEDATEEEKNAEKLKFLKEDLVSQQELINHEMTEYNEAIAEYGAQSQEANEAYLKVQEAEIERANTQKEINDLLKENIQREKDLIEEQRELRMSNADLEYQIWENTTGRNATDEEKELKQLEKINKNIVEQTANTNDALVEYNKILADKAGDTSNEEVVKAYNAYLQELSSLTDLQADAADIQESIADRQKRTQERQETAQKEYKKYMEKYRKYYLANGFSLDELEKDARLVSGYDPNKAVNNVVTATNTAVNNITTSAAYKETVSSFTNLGTEYVKAVGTGVTEATPTIIDSATAMIDKCIKAIKEKQTVWKGTGIYLVTGLINGINSRTSAAVSAMKILITNMLNAANEVAGINSPSKETEQIGKYLDMGLAKGLSKYSNLSENEATNVGASVMDRLRNTIANISDIVSSEIDTEPTIRPVLDLSAVKSQTATLNTMFSRSQAMSISAKMSNHSDEIQNGEHSSKTGNTYQFTQNNYSPKALSPVEVYRQTKNQFAAMKEVLG